MKKNYLFLLITTIAFSTAFGQIQGTWKLAPQAVALGVGPELGNTDWWSNSADDVDTRACLFDDQFKFNADGSFENVLGDADMARRMARC
jgi:hypothetical protein